MNRVLCRLCFNESTQEMEELSENSQTFIKLSTSMRIVIKQLKDPLPKSICNNCSDKIDGIHQFYQQIIESEDLLLQYTNTGTEDLKNLYFKLQNKVKIKEENNTNFDNKENENNLEDIIKIKDALNIIITEKDDNDHDDSNLDTIQFESDDNLEEMPHKQKLIDAIPNTELVLVNKLNEQCVVIKTSQFKCLTCFELFDSQSSLLHHYNTEHFRKTENTLIIENNYEMVTLPDGSSLFKCNECIKQYNNKKSIVRHKLLAHTNERPFICKLCGRTYKTASEILRHSRAHSGTRLYCSEQCGYSTVYLGALKEHERRHNKTEVKYKCEKCDKGFQVKTWYEQHQNVHTGRKPFVCDICGVAFHMDRYLTAHRSSVHPQSSNLKRYVCVHCSLPYDSRKALTLHLKVHGINTNFLCDLCGKTLSNGEQLKFHKRMHLGVKPFSCSTCDKSFAKKFNLQLHERTHTGDKAHACSACGKRYSQRSTLHRHHKRHHSNTDQLKCVKCDKIFATHNQFAGHKNLCI